MPASLATDRHPARRLAVPSFHPELSRCGGAACQAWARYLIRERSQLGAQIRTDDRSDLRRCVPDRAIDGISTRLWSGSPANICTCGAQWIMKARFSRSWFSADRTTATSGQRPSAYPPAPGSRQSSRADDRSPAAGLCVFPSRRRSEICRSSECASPVPWLNYRRPLGRE